LAAWHDASLTSGWIGGVLAASSLQLFARKDDTFGKTNKTNVLREVTKATFLQLTIMRWIHR